MYIGGIVGASINQRRRNKVKTFRAEVYNKEKTVRFKNLKNQNHMYKYEHAKKKSNAGRKRNYALLFRC